MKNILVIGKLDQSISSFNSDVTKDWQVENCIDSFEMVEGMTKIKKPDLSIIDVCEKKSNTQQILDFFLFKYKKSKVLILGEIENCIEYQNYIREDNFYFLAKPITEVAFLAKCSEILATIKEKPTREFLVKRNILLVDDSALVLRTVKGLLEDFYNVTVANSGKQALRCIKQERPDLILLDYEMPEFDGKDTLESIRKDNDIKNIPVVFLTGMADKEHIASVVKLNPQGYVIKPPEKKRLYEIIEGILRD